MGDSDDEYDRKRRDKFRGERSDSYQRGEGRRGTGDDRRRDDWIESRDSWGSRTRPRTEYRDYRGSARERYSPTRTHDISPPLKRMRTDWDDRRGYPHDASGAGYAGYSTPWGHESYSQSHYSNHSFPQRMAADSQGNETQPPMLSFKAYLQTQEDSITDAEALRKYGEYKLEFKRQQLNEFFVAHKEEEWFKIKYHPEDSVRRKDEQLNALKRRVAVFLEFLDKDRLDKVSVDSDQSEALIKLLDAVVIRLEGGTDNDLLVLEHTKEDDKKEKKETKEENEKTTANNTDSKIEKVPSPKEQNNMEENAEGEIIPSNENPLSEEDVKISSPKEEESENKKTEDTESTENQDKPDPIEITKSKRDSYDSDSALSSSEDEKPTQVDSANEEEEDENKIEKDIEVKENLKSTETSGSMDEELDEKKDELEEEKEDQEIKEEPMSPKKESKSDDGTEDISDKEENDVEEKEEKESEDPKEGDGDENGEIDEGEESVKIVEQTDKPASATKSKSVSIDDENKPRPLHKTASIFLRNLAPTITKAEVEAMCKRFPGFLRVAIADPQPERRWFRRGWVTFERQVNIKEICWNLNNIRLRDCELGAIVNRDLSRRIRTVNGITSHKHVVRHDIKLSARIVHNLDSKCGLWSEGENEIPMDVDDSNKDDELTKQLLSFGLVSTNPVLRNITDYLIEEASAEEEELLGVTADQEEGQIGADTPAANRDENLLKVLDKLLLYLRIVHSVDYYNHCEYPIEDEMPNRCGIMHARGTPPSSRVTLTELQEYCRTFENKIAAFLQPPATVPDEEYSNLGHKDPDSEVEKFVLANTQELAKDKWLCPLSGKKFKGPEFVRKHIFNKHTEKVDEVRKEVSYFNNYLRDPKRPQLAEHPGNATSGSTGNTRSTSGRGKDEREIAGYPPPAAFPHHYQYGYGRHAYGPHYSTYGGGYNQGYGGQGGYGRHNRGGGYNRGRGPAEFRPVIHYRDLDAPRELEEFI